VSSAGGSWITARRRYFAGDGDITAVESKPIDHCDFASPGPGPDSKIGLDPARA